MALQLTFNDQSRDLTVTGAYWRADEMRVRRGGTADIVVNCYTSATAASQGATPIDTRTFRMDTAFATYLSPAALAAAGGNIAAQVYAWLATLADFTGATNV